MSLQLEWGEVLEVRGVSLWLHCFGTYWALGFADAPFETTQRPPVVKPRAAAELSTAQGMRQNPFAVLVSLPLRHG